MSNLSYCQFRNTLADLNDVDFREDCSPAEHIARKNLIKKCKEIAEDFEGNDGEGLPKEDLDDD